MVLGRGDPARKDFEPSGRSFWTALMNERQQVDKSSTNYYLVTLPKVQDKLFTASMEVDRGGYKVSILYS